jgi:hypothetical protein
MKTTASHTSGQYSTYTTDKGHSYQILGHKVKKQGKQHHLITRYQKAKNNRDS